MGNGRGEIHNRDRAKQLINFSGLRYGTITPTDIDGQIEFHGKCFVYIELKYKDTPIPDGQKKALMQDVDNHNKPTILIIGTHNIPPERDIDASICVVREYYSKGKWYKPKKSFTIKKLIDEFIYRYAPECLHLHPTE